MDKIYEPNVRDIICTGRYCDKIIAQVYDEQFVVSGNLTIYQSFKPICICGKPAPFFHPSELQDEAEQYQSRLAFRREILRSLNQNEKHKKQKQKKIK
jgi:hypothetical protein